MKKIMILIISVFIGFVSCQKDNIDFENTYLSVSDFKHYCQCDKKFFSRKKVNNIISNCNDKTIKIKGYIINNIDTNTHEIILGDIKNGESISVYFSQPYLETDSNSHRSQILQKILSTDIKKRMYYFIATSKATRIESGMMYAPNVYLLLRDEDDIIIK